MSAHRGHLLKPILLPHQYKTRNYMIWWVRWCIGPAIIGRLLVDLQIVLSVFGRWNWWVNLHSTLLAYLPKVTFCRQAT
jgi:hypothetical protein